jgi:Phosphopantetheinyl transferase component of siderophore synthetase
VSVPLRPAELDTKHETVPALRALVPEARVAGGSFATWLPHPASVLVSEREALVASAREVATERCIRDLLRQAGLDQNLSIVRGEGGARRWPTGFVGSLTHKGTIVLGVIAPARAVGMIGIDLERVDGDDLDRIEALIAQEGLAPGMDLRLARLLSFSAKEAVFKAQFPETRLQLAFSDVHLVWEAGGKESLRAMVHCPVEGLIVRASFAGRWVVSSAISSVKTGT